MPPNATASPRVPPRARLICGDMADVALVRIQGESRPRLPDAYQTDHFVFYYTHDPSGNHAPALDDTAGDGVPDYVNNLGLYFERAWAFYTAPAPGGLGYDAPPRSSGRYPVCVYSLADGFSGQTWPDSKSGKRSTSHISIDAHLYEPYVRAVAAHELFHAFQFGYNYTASPWWKEASADWASNEVFPDVDTYIIPYYDWFRVPGWPLDYTDGWHEYGDSIWAKHLVETHGRDFIRAIWLNQRTENDSLKVITKTLGSMGTTLAAQFRDFAAWNWLKAEDIAASPVARGLTVRLKAENGLDAQLILERTDGTRSTVAVSGARYHVAGFEQNFQRVVVVLSNGDAAVKHSFTGSVGLGVVYRDQYGYTWDMEIAPDGTVRGAVDVGDRQPWIVQGQIKAGGFHWRALNPSVQKGWTTGFDVTGTLPDTASSSVRWTNDAGRSDVWTGALVNGPVPVLPLSNLRGPALQ
jgi:hypothetical protein